VAYALRHLVRFKRKYFGGNGFLIATGQQALVKEAVDLTLKLPRTSAGLA